MFGFGKKKDKPENNMSSEGTNLKSNQVMPANISPAPPQIESPPLQQEESLVEGKPVEPEKKKGFFSSLGDNLKKGYEVSKEGMKSAASKVKEKTMDAGKSMMNSDFVKKYGVDTYNEVKEKLAEIKEDIANEITNSEYFKKMKFKLSRFVVLKVEKLIDSQLEKVPALIIKATDDEDMCGSVKRLKDDIILEFFPDLKEEILFMLRMQLSQPYLDLQDPPKRCCLIQCMYSLRAWILYTLDPVDRSIWKSLKTFSWWVLQLVQLFPFYGVQAFFMLSYFLLMCKDDEFQLVNYIVSFKSLQFFTMGCINGLIAYIIYFFCISTSSGANDTQGINACSAKGASDNFHYWIEIGQFFLRILLIWICYFALPCAERKGQVSFRIKSDHEKEKDALEAKKCYCFRTGGKRLSCLMVWEFITELLTAGLFVILYFFVIKSEKASMRESIYFCQIIYAVLSFPFLIFSIPCMTVILTKSRETKYDKYGRCVPNIPSLLKIKEKEKAREMKKAGTSEGDDLEKLIGSENVDFFKEIDGGEETTLSETTKGKSIAANKGGVVVEDLADN